MPPINGLSIIKTDIPLRHSLGKKNKPCSCTNWSLAKIFRPILLYCMKCIPFSHDPCWTLGCAFSHAAEPSLTTWLHLSSSSHPDAGSMWNFYSKLALSMFPKRTLFSNQNTCVFGEKKEIIVNHENDFHVSDLTKQFDLGKSRSSKECVVLVFSLFFKQRILYMYNHKKSFL